MIVKTVRMIFSMSVCAIFIFACNRSSTTISGTGGLVEIDVSKRYPEKVLYLQDIAKVEYIPLETNINTLMRSSARIVHVSDNYIIASNMSDGDVFVFDGKGKSKFSFNNKGGSGIEYNFLTSIAFDEQAREIFIFSGASAHPKIIVYSEDGQFKRSFELPRNFRPQIYNFDDATLLAYDDFGVLQNRGYSETPYTFISKEDGAIIDTLNVHLPIRISNRSVMEVEVDGRAGQVPITLYMPNNRSYGKNFLIADMSSDTIYRLTPQRELQPVIVRIPPLHKLQNPNIKTLLTNDLVTDRYIFLIKAVMDFESAKRTRTFPIMGLMYDFQTGELNEWQLINRDTESSVSFFDDAIACENTGIYKLDVARLFENDEAGKIKGELKELLNSLDEEDNPILVKIKF